MRNGSTDIDSAHDIDITLQSEELVYLKKLGFKVNNHNRVCTDIQHVIEFWKEWQNKSKKQD